MSDSKILSFEEFVNQGISGETDCAKDTPMMGSDSENLPVPAEPVNSDDSEQNVPNNMIEEESIDNEASEAEVEVEGSADDMEQSVN